METITIFVCGDSSGNPGAAALGVYMEDQAGNMLSEVAERIGNATADFAEYQSVMRGLQEAKEIFTEKTKEMSFIVKLDNETVKKQLNGELEITAPALVPYFIEIHNLRVSSFPNLTLTYLPREKNKKAESLMNKTLDASI